jgi:CopG family transcriptional regulator/antitoxin EndoAI
MAKRINVILPNSVVSTLDRLVKPGERSRFIDRAIQHYVATRSVLGLHEQLKQAALRDRDIVQEIAADWAAVDNETWNIDERKEVKRGRAAVRFTSRVSTRR